MMARMQTRFPPVEESRKKLLALGWVLCSPIEVLWGAEGYPNGRARARAVREWPLETAGLKATAQVVTGPPLLEKGPAVLKRNAAHLLWCALAPKGS